MWRIPGVGFEWNILSKGVCGLGFEERKGCKYVVVYGVKLVLFGIFKKGKGHKHKNLCKDGNVCRICLYSCKHFKFIILNLIVRFNNTLAMILKYSNL